MLFFTIQGDTYRWKGENVSASEVEKIVLTANIVSEAVVYGSSIKGIRDWNLEKRENWHLWIKFKIQNFVQNLNLSKGNEGKVGTVVLKNEPGQVVTEKDLEKIVQICKENLQPAACPRIYRVQVWYQRFFESNFFSRKVTVKI